MSEVWTAYAEIKKRWPLYDKIAVVEGYNHRAVFAGIVKPYSSPDRSLLDIGCGTADHMVVYSRDFGRVIGVDFNATLIKEAERNTAGLSNTTVVCMNTEDMQLDGDFDVVTSVFNPINEKTMREVSRVLKKGGIFLRTSCAGDFVNYGGRRLLRPQDVVGRGWYANNVENYARDNEVALVAEAGLSVSDEAFKCMKLFSRFDDFVGHVRNSGHFRLHKPYTELTEWEINLLRERSGEFSVRYEGADFFALPFDSLLIVAQKPSHPWPEASSSAGEE